LAPTTPTISGFPVITTGPNVGQVSGADLVKTLDNLALTLPKIDEQTALDMVMNSSINKINNLYENLLGREGDVAGLQFYNKALSSGTTDLEGIKNSILQSQEYKNLVPVTGQGSSDNTTGLLEGIKAELETLNKSSERSAASNESTASMLD